MKPLVPPIHPSAVYTFSDLDAVDAFYRGEQPGFVYARDGHPNASELSRELARWESATWGQITGSGMAAISATVLALVSAGDRVVASDRLYGKTTHLFQNELGRFGIDVAFVDACDLAAVRDALAIGRTRMFFVETISNPLCRVVDLPALAEIAGNAGVAVVVDNTFATPAVCRPLELGADIVIESLTKLIGGHSDLTLGFIGGRDPEQAASFADRVSTWGLSAGAFDCWLATRGLETLSLRAAAATSNAAAVAEWLSTRPGVTHVAYPGQPDHPDHQLAGRLFDTAPGNMLAFELAGGRDAVNRWMRTCTSIPFAPSLGHTTTTCSHPASTSHRSVRREEHHRQGITDGLIRLSVGCEPLDSLLSELSKGLPG